MEPKKRSNKKLWITLLVLPLLGLCALFTGGAGYLGYQYYKENRGSLLNGEDQPPTTDFTTQTIYTPTGDIIDLVKQVGPSVVTVVSKTQVSTLFSDESAEVQNGTGTGFFVSENGLLITNQHVVCDSTSASNISIVTSQNKTYEVESFAADPTQDIAILKVKTNGEKVPFLKFANTSSQLLVGQDVLAIGNPLGVNPGSVTRGIVSGLGRNIQAQGQCGNRTTVKEYEGVIQTDAAINPGNSGGPLLNLKGEVIGVNSATSSNANNISYAVPFDRVVKLLNRYETGRGSLKFPYLGVQYTMIDPNAAKANDVPEGAFVRQVVAEGPAAKAGLRKNDIITKIGDKKIEFSLQSTLNQHFEPGQTVKVELYRPNITSLFGGEVNLEGQTLTIDVVVGER